GDTVAVEIERHQPAGEGGFAAQHDFSGADKLAGGGKRSYRDRLQLGCAAAVVVIARVDRLQNVLTGLEQVALVGRPRGRDRRAAEDVAVIEEEPAAGGTRAGGGDVRGERHHLAEGGRGGRWRLQGDGGDWAESDGIGRGEWGRAGDGKRGRIGD